MAYIDFITKLHKKAKRNYLARVVAFDKAKCATVAKQLGRRYWDGPRQFGYGGYYYDGRWKPVAQALIKHYKLKPGQRVLDIGCGKGFLLYELKTLMPGLQVTGIDISRYALKNSKKEIRPFLRLGTACKLPYPDGYFDLVISLNTLHFLYIYDLERAIREIERVKRGGSYIVEESYRNEVEKNNLLLWQLTCECFFTPAEWTWVLKKFGYTGDYSFIFFQ